MKKEKSKITNREIGYVCGKIYGDDVHSSRLRGMVFMRMENRTPGDSRKSEFIREIIDPWMIDEFNAMTTIQKGIILDCYIESQKVKESLEKKIKVYNIRTSNPHTL